MLFRAARALERCLGSSVAGEAPAASGAASDVPSRAIPVVVTGLGELGRRLALRCAASGVQARIIDDRDEALEEFRRGGIATVRGDPGDETVLRKGGVADARILIVTSASLAAKMRVCIAARAVNPRIAIVATSESAAERAWLEEFGAAYVCDALDEMSDAMLRAVRSGM
jgi:CPA2 family monovalent cation:H+ antiporter-2